jgi:hypothetical protein
MKVTRHLDRSPEFRILILTISFLVLISSMPVQSQNVRKEVPPLRERLFYGGSIGLQFGNITDIQLSPVIGLWVLPRLTVAAGPDYRFYKDPYVRTDIFGGSIYTQFFFIQDLDNLLKLGMHYRFFVMAEDELLSLKTSSWKYPPYSSDRFFINTPMAGGGISQPLGQRSSIDLMILWPLQMPDYDIYSNPEIRVNIIF